MVDDVSNSKQNTNFQLVRAQALRELKVFLEKNDPGNVSNKDK